MWFCFWLWEDIANYRDPLASSVSQLSRTAAWPVRFPSWLLQLRVPTSSERCCQGVWQQWICHFSSIWYFSLVPSLSEWHPRVAKGRKTWESSHDLPLLWTYHPRSTPHPQRARIYMDYKPVERPLSPLVKATIIPCAGLLQKPSSWSAGFQLCSSSVCFVHGCQWSL